MLFRQFQLQSYSILVHKVEHALVHWQFTASLARLPKQLLHLSIYLFLTQKGKKINVLNL